MKAVYDAFCSQTGPETAIVPELAVAVDRAGKCRESPKTAAPNAPADYGRYRHPQSRAARA
jgi:hypothetical protein